MPATESGAPAAPWQCVLAQLVGAALFVVGSICFIQSSFAAAGWLLPFVLGCIFWMPGCACYLLALAMGDCRPGCKLSVATSVQFLHASCMLSFIFGCVLGIHGVEAVVLARAGWINGAFLLGSICSLLEALLSVWHEARRRALKAWLGGLQMATGVSFVLAGLLGGGYTDTRPSPAGIRAGMMLWLVGSLCCIPAPATALAARALSRRPANRSSLGCAAVPGLPGLVLVHVPSAVHVVRRTDQ